MGSGRRFWLSTLAGVLLLAPTAAAAEPQVPAHFHIAPAIKGVHHPTRLVFGPDGRLYIAGQTGEVMAITLKDGAEVSRDQVATAKQNLLGIALKGEKLWVSDTGNIAVYTRDKSGRYGDRQVIVGDLPHGRHENDGLAWGPDGKLYFGLGSTSDQGPEEHPFSATVMRVNPDGTGLEVFARGLRNPYGIAFDPAGKLWANDNGADDPVATDKLYLVEPGGYYGFAVKDQPKGPVRAPVALYGDHNSTNGLAVYTGSQFPEPYRGGLFSAQWGSSYDDATGRDLAFVKLTKTDKGWRGEVSRFASGFDRPLDVTMGPAGDLWLADFHANTVYRIWYEPDQAPAQAPPSERTSPPDTAAQQPPAPPGAAAMPGLVVWLGGGAVALVLVLLLRRLRRR